MNFLVIYAIVAILSLSTYLFNTSYLTVNDFKESYKFIVNTVLKALRLSKHESLETPNIDLVVSKTGQTLNKSLKHLEFIGGLESYIDSRNECALSTDCLYELEDSKYMAQMSVLKSTSILSALHRKEAA